MAHIEDRARRSNRSNGLRWRVRYADPDGKEHSKSFAKKSDAEQFLVTVSADVLRGTYIDPAAGRMSFGTYAQQWFERQVHVRPTSTMMYDSHLRNHIVPLLGSTRLSALQRTDVAAVVKVWSTTLAPSTVGTVHSITSSILADAVLDERISKNVAQGVPLPGWGAQASRLPPRRRFLRSRTQSVPAIELPSYWRPARASAKARCWGSRVPASTS